MRVLRKLLVVLAAAPMLLFGACFWLGLLSRYEASQIRESLASLPGVRVVDAPNFQEEDFGGPEIYADLEIQGHRIELAEVTLESLRCEEPIWLWSFDGSRPLCLQQTESGSAVRSAIDLCRASAIFEDEIHSIDQLPQAFPKIRTALSNWPRSPDAGVRDGADSPWRCFLAAPDWSAPTPAAFLIGSPAPR